MAGKVVDIRHRRLSSKVTTGRRVFVESGDGRSAWARRWKDLTIAHVNDLGAPDDLSEAQISICRRAATMEIKLEALEARMSEGQHVDIDQYSRLTGRLCQLFDLIGTKRSTKPVDPQSELVKAMQAYAGEPIDDDDEA
jgi:hypothetical protein